MESYGSVLERMQQTFQELAGFSADDASDLGIRLKVLAGEVYSLLNGVEWLKNQMFPQTAQGEYLMMHAAQRGLSRKSATPSSGTLVFGRSGTLPYDVLIPKGTVCAVSGEAGPRFETTQDITLPAGAQTAQGPAVSQQGGKESNAAAGTVTLLLTPPAGVETVANPQAFTGGADEETDEELRKRLLKSYEVLPNGTNAEFYRSYVVQYDGIQSASVLPRADGSGTVAIYAAGFADENTIGAEQPARGKRRGNGAFAGAGGLPNFHIHRSCTGVYPCSGHQPNPRGDPVVFRSAFRRGIRHSGAARQAADRYRADSQLSF